MDLALSILFLWIGAALLFVAFHQLSLETGKGSPGDVFKSLRAGMTGATNAYESTSDQ